jgi:hypothetical protein
MGKISRNRENSSRKSLKDPLLFRKRIQLRLSRPNTN